jgi:tripartite-type tricarboxylate transporter receptor subunit TctC
MKRFLAAALFMAVCAAHAQDYPNKPIRMLVPFAPGGAVDTTARVLAQARQQRLNWQFVTDNRPGGNGFIATTAVQKAPPDGYTLVMAHTGEFAVNPALFDNVPYELERDFAPITMVSDAPMLIGKGPAANQQLRELIGGRRAEHHYLRLGRQRQHQPPCR